MIVVLSGAGMSAESGLSTFRDAGGLWEGHEVMEVASPEGWAKNPELVNHFYNLRRRDLLNVEPNAAHNFISQLESRFNVHVITQNVDDLHERAGSQHVMHLHGELFKVQSTKYPDLIYEWKKDLALTDLCERGHPLRPAIVWFGEAVPLIPAAAALVAQARLVIIIGTSLQVYPAAGLAYYAQSTTPIIYIDPNPAAMDYQIKSTLHVISKKATESLVVLDDFIQQYLT